MLLPKRCHFVRCDEDSVSVEAADPAISLTYENSLFNDGSDVTPSD